MFSFGNNQFRQAAIDGVPNISVGNNYLRKATLDGVFVSIASLA